MDLRRKPSAGRYGVDPVFIRMGPIGGTNNIGGATPLTANATTTFKLGGFHRKVAFLRFSVSLGTLPVDADGTVLARMRKNRAGTITTVSSDISLEGMTANVSEKAGVLSTVTDAGRVFLEGDTVEVDIVNNSAAIDTQPATMYLVGEFALLD